MRKILLLMLFLMIWAPVSVADANMIPVGPDSDGADVGLMIVDADTSNRQEFLMSPSQATVPLFMDANNQDSDIVLHRKKSSSTTKMFLGIPWFNQTDFLMDAQYTEILLHNGDASGFEMFLGYIHGPADFGLIITCVKKKTCPKTSEIILEF